MQLNHQVNTNSNNNLNIGLIILKLTRVSRYKRNQSQDFNLEWTIIKHRHSSSFNRSVGKQFNTWVWSSSRQTNARSNTSITISIVVTTTHAKTDAEGVMLTPLSYANTRRQINANWKTHVPWLITEWKDSIISRSTRRNSVLSSRNTPSHASTETSVRLRTR